jgi:hypothetical protein
MDSDRFDDLSRTLATQRSRRAVLGAIGAALVGLVTGQATSAAPKKDKPSAGHQRNQRVRRRRMRRELQRGIRPLHQRPNGWL